MSYGSMLIVLATICRGISGGERKRVSVGHELLIDPSILMLDGAASQRHVVLVASAHCCPCGNVHSLASGSICACENCKYTCSH